MFFTDKIMTAIEPPSQPLEGTSRNADSRATRRGTALLVRRRYRPELRLETWLATRSRIDPSPWTIATLGGIPWGAVGDMIVGSRIHDIGCSIVGGGFSHQRWIMDGSLREARQQRRASFL